MSDTLQTPQAMVETKKPWQSKTQWASAIAVLAPLIFPPLGAWIALNPELYSATLGAIFSGLRLLTKEKVVIK